MERDQNLLGNKLIEDAIKEMYKSKTDEHLAKVLYKLRDRMTDGGHLVVAVKPGQGEHLELRPVRTPDGNTWFAAFTSFEEELKKKDEMVSGFTAEIAQLFDIALQTETVAGVIINPWDKALKLDKRIIELVMNK